MATKSFDTPIVITRKNAKSLIRILNKDKYQTVDLHSKTVVQPIDLGKLEQFVKKQV